MLKKALKKHAVFLRLVLAVLGITLLLTLSSCGITNSGDSSPVDITKFSIYSPYQALPTANVVSIGAGGFSGTEQQIADAILQWQDENMVQGSPFEFPDISYPMRWNHFLPGIYPVSEMITERVSSGNIYGVCWDYSAIFCAIASHYNLKTRITAWKLYMAANPSDPPEARDPQTGLSPAEYSALNVKLTNNNLNFSYSRVNSAIKETFVHYRAEVWLTPNWVAYDGTGPTGEYANDDNYSVVEWDDYFDADLGTR